MPTLSWGASMESLLAETPSRQTPIVLETMAEELRKSLCEALAAGHNMTENMPMLCELVVAWLAETAWSNFEPLPATATDMSKKAMWCLQCHEKAGTAAKAVLKEQTDMNAKLANADQAVAKALQAVIQQGGSATSPATAQQVTEKMAVWKKGVRDGAMEKVAAAQAVARATMKEMEDAIRGLVVCAHQSFQANQPPTEDDMLTAMMEQVQMHMQQLEVSSGGGGTGGTIQRGSMEFEDTQIDDDKKDNEKIGDKKQVPWYVSYHACVYMYIYI